MQTDSVSAFEFSTDSLNKLAAIDNRLAKVCRRALQLTRVDFKVIEGLRTMDRQMELVAAGASWTLKSKHLVGLAVDIAPIVARKVCWDWPLFPPLADAMKQAALEQGIILRWGGVWDRELTSFIKPAEEELADYLADKSRHGLAKPDGPHFELVE